MNRLVAVVVAYEQPELLERCLASLPTAGVDGAVVVDNSERQGGAVAAAARRHGARYLAAGGNTGFGAAANRGIATAVDAGATHVFVLNPDAVVVAAPGRPPLTDAVVVPVPEGDAEVLLGRYDMVLGMTRPGRPRRPWHFTFVSGAAFVAPVEHLGRAPFPEGYFLYHEDVALSFDLHRRGVPVVAEPDLVVAHRVGSVDRRGFTPEYCTFNSRNRLLFARSHLLPWGLFAVLATPLDMARVLRASCRRGGLRAALGLVAPLLRGVGAGLSRSRAVSGRRGVVDPEGWRSRSSWRPGGPAPCSGSPSPGRRRRRPPPPPRRRRSRRPQR